MLKKGYLHCHSDKKEKVNNEVIADNNKSQTGGNFYPSEKTVEKFDTLIQNKQIQVTIIKKDLDSYVVNEYQEDGVKQVDKYRDAEIALRIKQNALLVLDTVFRKNQFLKYTDRGFLDVAIFHNYWFEGLENGNLKFMGVVSKPETDWTFSFDHVFSLKGKTLKLTKHPDSEI